MRILGTALVCTAVAHATAVLVLFAEHRRRSRPLRSSGPLVSVGAGVAVGWLAMDDIVVSLLAGALTAAVLLRARRRLHCFRPAGVSVLVTHALFLASGLVWMAWFLATMPVSPLSRALVLAGAPLLALNVPPGLVRTLQLWEPLCRRDWRRPRAPLPPAERAEFPRVSIHVPAHAEPPDVVIATLDALARLDYPNFEVLVVDNNTADPALWRPIAVHCRLLGQRFRFFHVEGLTGAKGGALNYALAKTDPDAELVAVVDADYHAEPDWLRCTVGYFDDPKMAFVQSPHAYRDWDASRFLTTCNWEYAQFFVTVMVSLNEYDAAPIVGTMSLIRRGALEEAGGWSEWCLTEDSELAIRIHALGYSSVYLTHVYGRGLIPDTFAGYKQQRFRWTYGPVQELRHHFRLYLPGRWRQPSRMTLAQRLHHPVQGLLGLSVSPSIALVPVGAAFVVSVGIQGEVVSVPAPLWVGMAVLLASSALHFWFVYRRLLGAPFRHIVAAKLAAKSLGHVATVAQVSALLARRVPWRRTDKFRRPGRGWRALGCVRTELVLATVWMAFGVLALVAFPRSGIAVLIEIGILLQGVGYLAAPAMTLLAERDLSLRARQAGGAGPVGPVGDHRPLEGAAVR